MKKIRKVAPFIVLCFIALFGLVSCGGTGESETDSPAAEQAKKVRTHPRTSDSEKKKPIAGNDALNNARVINITVLPENPTVTSTLTVNAEISTPETVGIELKYIYWIDSVIVKEENTNTFPLKNYRKGSFFFVDVVMLKDGTELARKRSKMIRILNSSPNIRDIDFPTALDAGKHRISVSAEDADGDPLTYSIEGENLPPNLSIDPNTGLITLQVDERPPEKLSFFLVVKDDDEGEAKQEVTINFKQFAEKEEGR